MNKKEKIQILIATFKQAGCELLSEPSLTKKMIFRCECGENAEKRWWNFKNGERCKRCTSIKRKASNIKRLKVAGQIHQRFIENGCILLDKDYANQSTPMNYICSCGRQDVITWKCFQKGHRCHQCAKEKIANRHIPSGADHYYWNPDREVVYLRKSIRLRAKRILKRTLNGQMKLKTTFELLGYTKEQLIDHIRNHSNWEAVKDIEWEIDHYFPMAAFNDYGIQDIKVINCLENLRPLSKNDNRAKNDRYDQIEFENWLQKKSLVAHLAIK